VLSPWPVDALTASYAAARQIKHVAYFADFVKHIEPRAAERDRLATLIRDAHAAVIVFDPVDWQTCELIDRCRRRELPVRMLGIVKRGCEVLPPARIGGFPD
jgi:hypothetical protein